MSLTPGDEFIVYEYEDDDFWAVYKNGHLVNNGSGEGTNDLLNCLDEHGALKHRVRDSSMFLGDEDCDTPASTVQEIEDYNSKPDWEQEAMQLEARARHLRQQGATRGW